MSESQKSEIRKSLSRALTQVNAITSDNFRLRSNTIDRVSRNEALTDDEQTMSRVLEIEKLINQTIVGV